MACLILMKHLPIVTQEQERKRSEIDCYSDGIGIRTLVHFVSFDQKLNVAPTAQLSNKRMTHTPLKPCHGFLQWVLWWNMLGCVFAFNTSWKKAVPSLFNIIFLTWQDLQEHSWHSYASLQEDCRIIEQLSTGGCCNSLMHRKKILRLVTGMQRLVKNEMLLTDILPWSQECWICEVEGWISGLWISWNSFHTWMFLWHVWDIWETCLTMHTFGWMISLWTVLCGFSDNCNVLAALFFPQGCSQSEPTHCLGACAFACLHVHVVSCTSYIASTCTCVYMCRI